ncbi:MAG: DUF3194 domain-containing protein [Sulfolobales archaeon]
MVQHPEEEEAENKTFEEVVIGLDLGSVTRQEIEEIVSIFESSIRDHIEKSILRPLINGYIIETSIELSGSINLKVFIEVYPRKDVPRDIVYRLIDEAIESGFREAEKIIERYSKKTL